MKNSKVAPFGLAASLLAGLLVTACSDRSDNETVTKTETSATVVEATPSQQDPMIDPNASTSATSTGADAGMATDTTDAMSGVAPTETATAERKIIPKRHAKHVKKSKKTKTTTSTSRNESTSPVYDNSDVVVAPAPMETESGSTTGAGEISSTIEQSPLRGPGRLASANTDWGVVYQINDAEAASNP